MTIWAHRRTHRVEQQNVALQRQINETQVQHEKERREAERRREEEQRRATDARISGTAYALRRQLLSWIGEAPEEVQTLVSLADKFRELHQKAGEPGTEEPADVPGVTEGVLDATVRWAHSGQAHFDRAEARMLQLVVAAPDGTPAVAESLRRVYVLFYQATNRLNQQVAAYGELHVANEPELATAYHEIEQCALELGTAVGPELLKAEELMAKKDWLPKSEA